MKGCRILVADDHAMVRAGLRALLDLEPDFQVIGEAENGRRTLSLAVELCPAVIVMDISMPVLNGLEATRQITKLHPEIRILILSSHWEDSYLDQAVKNGAAGFLLKQDASHFLPDAIRRVCMGTAFLSPALTDHLASGLRRWTARGNLAMDHPKNQLTSREVEILQLVAEGLANKTIALELGISIKTVEKHRQSLMEKLDIHETAGLTRYAIASGVIECGLICQPSNQSFIR